MSETERAKILFVGNPVTELPTLTETLAERGYAVQTVDDGVQALVAVQDAPPDLILLSDALPETDGYEICRQLKADARMESTPVLFFAPSNEAPDSREALAAGGVDWLVEPLQAEETLARIEMHLALQKLKRDLAKKDTQIERFRDELAREIVEHSQAEETLHRYAERLQILRETDQAILAAQSPETIAVAAIRRIRRLIPFRRAIVLATRQNDRLNMLAAESYRDTQPLVDMTLYQKVTQEPVLQRGLVQGNEDLTVLPRRSSFEHALYAAGIRSYVIIPLFIQEELLGTLHLESDRARAFTPDHIAIAVEVTASLAVAIRQVRLYEQSQFEIAERKQIELALRASENRFRAVVEDQTELICRWQPNGKLTFVNDAYCRYFGKRRQELLGQSFRPVIPEDEQAQIQTHIASLTRDKPISSSEHRVILADGEVRWQRWIYRALFDEKGELVEFQSVGRDVTERKRAEEQVRQHRDLLHSTIEALDHPFYVVNTNDFTIEMANTAARKLNQGRAITTCYALSHQQDQPCSGVDHPCPMEQVVQTKEAATMEHIHHDVAGEARFVEVHGYPLFDLDGNVVQMIESIQDITERRRAEQARREAAAAAERERLARDLHDSVTQALFSATLVAEVLPQVWQRDPDEALEGVAELRNLTRGALAEMRTLLLELRPAALVESNLGDLLQQLATAVTGRVETRVDLDLEPTPKLLPDEHLTFYRIAQEALHNAVKHAQASRMVVSLRASPPYSPELAAKWQGKVELKVQDNGCGFDPNRTKPGRLGLSVMHERAEAIGATLTIDSQQGQGTCVTLLYRLQAPKSL